MKRILLLLPLLVGAAAPSPQGTPIEAPGPIGALEGTLLQPAAGHDRPQPGPVVLIIPGSGPTDRDGDSPLGVRAAPYRLLAEGLAAHGVTTVRIDKRGMFGSAAATKDANAVTIGGYADDVHSWIKVIRQRTGASCVWLLGHSEGGLVALVAAQHQTDVCGVVLVAAAGRPMGEVLRAQLEANPANAPLLGQIMPDIDALEAGKHIDDAGMAPALRALFRPQVQDLLIDEFRYDPTRLLSGYAKPVLIVQGERDLQIGKADAERLEEADPRAKIVLLAGVNHVLKQVGDGGVQANIATYADPNLPLAPGVVDAIGDFLLH